jgi:hypothetical protein
MYRNIFLTVTLEPLSYFLLVSRPIVSGDHVTFRMLDMLNPLCDAMRKLIKVDQLCCKYILFSPYMSRHLHTMSCVYIWYKSTAPSLETACVSKSILLYSQQEVTGNDEYILGCLQRSGGEGEAE